MEDLETPREVCYLDFLLEHFWVIISLLLFVNCNGILKCLSCRWPWYWYIQFFLCISYKQVPASFTLSSSGEHLISKLSEAVCIAALQNTQREFLNNLQGDNRSGFFHWFQKPEKIQSKDSSVFLYKLFEDEIVENARSLLDKYNLMKDSIKPIKTKSMHCWWKPSCYEKLQKIGGSDFSAWASEYVPTYRLEIDAKIMGDAKIDGWKKSAENRWEVLLTHSQMVLYLFLLHWPLDS